MNETKVAGSPRRGRRWVSWIAVAAGACAVLAVAAVHAGAISPNGAPSQPVGSTTDTDHAAHTHGVRAATQYTCSMHPEVASDAPGRCPKCGMTLVAKP